MKIKTIVLTILLTVGISFQSCERIDTGCDGPGSTLKYFDIKGLYLLNYKKTEHFIQFKLLKETLFRYQTFHILISIIF